jgi:hypothetical protein
MNDPIQRWAYDHPLEAAVYVAFGVGIALWAAWVISH